MDDAPPPVAPPTNPGPIIDPDAGALPLPARAVAIVDIGVGVLAVAGTLARPGAPEPSSLALGVLAPLGIALLFRSNIARLLLRLAHAALALLLLVTIAFIAHGLFIAGGPTGQRAQGPELLGGIVMLVALTMLTAVFAWGAQILGRRGVRDACRRRKPAAP